MTRNGALLSILWLEGAPLSNDENEPDDRVKKIQDDAEQRTDQFANVLIQCGQGQEVKNAMAYFLGVSDKLRDTEFKLLLAEIKLGMTESSLEGARQTIQSLYEIATEAPESQLRYDLTYFIDELKRKAAAKGLEL
jgi:hypothetical protein